MIIDLNEKTLDLLAIKSCPADVLPGDYCISLCDEVAYTVPICRACWLKCLTEESEGV